MSSRSSLYVPEKNIDLIEGNQRPRKGHLALSINCIKFSTEGIESYAFARWESILLDTMIVAAAIEFGDRVVKRPPLGWARRISLRIPVHDPQRWKAPEVFDSLLDAIGFLTGDFWNITFVKRVTSAPAPSSAYLDFESKSQAVLPYSDGMDSRAVGGILGSQFGQGLVRVRIGSKQSAEPKKGGKRQAFANVPYQLKTDTAAKETSARNRGFKFAVISAIAAYLTRAPEVVVSESGQGAIGPALITVGHAYPDYRNHPLFMKRMERFVTALFEQPIRYIFPRLWYTKAETLREYLTLDASGTWEATRSCWRSSQWSSFGGRRRQCGVCAACMLRRLSVHAAGLAEDSETYICRDMNAPTLAEAVVPGFSKLGRSYEEYALAGVLHLDHLADMTRENAKPHVQRHAALIAPALAIPCHEAEANLTAMLSHHAREWENYMNTLEENSFVRKWVRRRQ